MATGSGKVGSNPGLTSCYYISPMVHLTEQDIAAFQALHEKETGQQISREHAAEYANRLVRLVAFAY